MKPFFNDMIDFLLDVLLEFKRFYSESKTFGYTADLTQFLNRGGKNLFRGKKLSINLLKRIFPIPGILLRANQGNHFSGRVSPISYIFQPFFKMLRLFFPDIPCQ
jgi:hypothetical protein